MNQFLTVLPQLTAHLLTRTDYVLMTIASYWSGIGEAIDRICRYVLLDEENAPAKSIPNRSGNSSSRNAVLVLDASPSMMKTDWMPSRLKAAQKAAMTYVERLRKEEPDARVAVVAYYKHAKMMCRLTPVQDANRLARAIDRIKPESYTNITAGLESAMKILTLENGACQVLLLTDGEHNHGRSPKNIAAHLRKFAILESIGIGGSPADVDEPLLRSISSRRPDGAPRYRWIGDEEQLVEHFHELAGRITKT